MRNGDNRSAVHLKFPNLRSGSEFPGGGRAIKLTRYYWLLLIITVISYPCEMVFFFSAPTADRSSRKANLRPSVWFKFVQGSQSSSFLLGSSLWSQLSLSLSLLALHLRTVRNIHLFIRQSEPICSSSCFLTLQRNCNQESSK